MARVKRGVESRRKHKKVLKLAKGYRGARSRTFKDLKSLFFTLLSKQAVTRAGQYAYRDRRVKKRDFRSLWIIRINAAVRENGLTYSKFMSALKKMNIDLDRRVLAELAVEDSEAFSNLVSLAKENAA